MELKPHCWYVVEVSFFSTNPIHRALAYVCHDGRVELHHSGYEGSERYHTKLLSFFRVVAEVPEMNAADYPNRFKLSADAVER